MATAKLFGGIYDGEVVEIDGFMPVIPKPLPPPERGRVIYKYCGQHPDGSLMYIWRESDGYIRR